MLRALVLVLVLVGETPAPPPPHLRLDVGEVRLVEGDTVRALDRRAGAVALAGDSARIECGAQSEFELAWRGLASATVHGPAALELECVPELGGAPRLRLEQAQRLELEVRRGTLTLELSGVGVLEVCSGALQVRARPHGAFELLNRGGAVLELRRDGAEPLSIAAGQRVRVRAR